MENGIQIGLRQDFPARLSNNNPSFTTKDLIGIGTQVLKWLRTGVVMGPIPTQFALKNNLTLNMLFGVPKPDGSTRPILNLSDKKGLKNSVNELLSSELCTVSYAQFKEVVEIVKALGKDAWLWAKDLKDGYYNVSVSESDIYNLGFIFNGKIYVFQRLPMGLSSSPNIFTEFMHFPLWAIKNSKKNIFFTKVPRSSIDLNNFRKESDITVLDNDMVRIAMIFHYLDDILGT